MNKHRILRGMVQGSEVQRFRGSGFRGSGVQRFRGSGFRGSEVLSLEVLGSEVQIFRVQPSRRTNQQPVKS